jgi:lipoprotein-anchoring transpeptidase ErfK/SrfK
MAERGPSGHPGRRRNGALRALALLVAAVAVAVIAPQIVSAVSDGGDTAEHTATTAPGVNLGVAAKLFGTGDTAIRHRLSDLNGVSHWAQVLRAVPVYRRPGGPPFSRLLPSTPEHTDAIVLALRQRRDAAGQVWTQVRLPILPNNSTGWVDRNALGSYHTVDTHLVVNRETFTLTLWRSGKVVFRAPVGVGHSYWPTPAGQYFIREKLTRYANAFYGPLAFGTSARSAVLTDWPGGGYIGIHGTDEPQLIPGAISHGCIRLRNSDILRLNRLLPIGTPLTVV